MSSSVCSLCIRITLSPTLNISSDKNHPCPAPGEKVIIIPSRDNRHTVRVALDCATSIRKRVALESCTDLCNLNTDHRHGVSSQPCLVSLQLSAVEFAQTPRVHPQTPLIIHFTTGQRQTSGRPSLLPVRSGSDFRECCWS